MATPIYERFVPQDKLEQAAGFEAIITFGLILMVLNLANRPKLNGPFAPLAVGAYILAWAPRAALTKAPR